MSGESNNQNFDENISSFSDISEGLDFNTILLKYHTEQVETRKLKDRLAGYKTVVQQFSKFQGTITHLKKIEEEQAKKIAYYKAKDEEQQKKILYLEKQLQNAQVKENVKRGLTDLDLFHPVKGTSSQTSSSPSFEIIGKSPSSHSINKDVQKSPLQRAASAEQIVNVALNNTVKDILQYQEEIWQALPNASKDFLVESKIKATEHTTSPPAYMFSRGFSSSPVVSENYSSVLNQIHSYPPIKEHSASNFSISTGNKKTIWQMDHEALHKKVDSLAEMAKKSPGNNVTLPQAGNVWRNSADLCNHSVTPDFTAAENQVGSPDEDIKLKEWKSLNALIPESKEHINQYPGKSNDFTVANLEKHTSGKPSENSDYELVDDFDELSPKLDLTATLNNLNMAGELTDGNLCLVTRSEDLIKFPSLHTNSPSPEYKQNKMPRTPSPIYNQQNGAVTLPTDERTSLASQMESVLANLNKSDSPVEMSDMLYKFAENAKNMEEKMKEYKGRIKQLQIQIQELQCRPNSCQEENARLRDEIAAIKVDNDTLLEFIATLKENKENEVEHGWTSVFPAQGYTEPVRSHYPDSPMMKKIESLSIINTKLFQANKDWHNKWELLRQQTQEEKSDLEAKVKSLETVNESLRNNIASMENELQNQSTAIQELMKANSSIEEEKSSLLRVQETLNAELIRLKSEGKDMRRNKKILESELINLKNLSRNKDSQQTGNMELQSEIGLLKQQLAVFAEDFDKERKDRLLAESKTEQFRKELIQTRASQENKFKKLSVQIKTLENDLRAKARHNADLLYQVDDLKLKLQHEQRKSALASQNNYSYQLPSSSYQGPVALPYNSSINGHMTNPNEGGGVNNHLFGNSSMAQAGYVHQSSPEHLPGAWKCRHCTYVNFPNRSVCDICGYTVSNVESLPVAESGSGRNELQSRGEERKWRGSEDIVVDND